MQRRRLEVYLVKVEQQLQGISKANRRTGHELTHSVLVCTYLRLPRTRTKYVFAMYV